MTDRLKGVYVAFDKDYREDDAQRIIEAIKMIRGVEAVEGNVVNPDDWVNRTRIKIELQSKVFSVFNEEE